MWKSGNKTRQEENTGKKPTPFGNRVIESDTTLSENVRIRTVYTVDYCCGHAGGIGRWTLTEGTATTIDKPASGFIHSRCERICKRALSKNSKLHNILTAFTAEVEFAQTRCNLARVLTGSYGWL